MRNLSISVYYKLGCRNWDTNLSVYNSQDKQKAAQKSRFFLKAKFYATDSGAVRHKLSKS